MSCSAVFSNWHAELKWVEKSKWVQEALAQSADLQAMLDHQQQVVLMQSHHMSDFCKTCLSEAVSNLAVRRLQRLAIAVARISLRQRMQLVFEGYRARFALIGAIMSGTLVLNLVLTLLMHLQQFW